MTRDLIEEILIGIGLERLETRREENEPVKKE